jgi:hypothetical protein
MSKPDKTKQWVNENMVIDLWNETGWNTSRFTGRIGDVTEEGWDAQCAHTSAPRPMERLNGYASAAAKIVKGKKITQYPI